MSAPPEFKEWWDSKDAERCHADHECCARKGWSAATIRGEQQRAEGYRAGLEAAAKVAEEYGDSMSEHIETHLGYQTAATIATSLRALTLTEKENRCIAVVYPYPCPYRRDQHGAGKPAGHFFTPALQFQDDTPAPPPASEKREEWCAWCGEWGDHTSGKHRDEIEARDASASVSPNAARGEGEILFHFHQGGWTECVCVVAEFGPDDRFGTFVPLARLQEAEKRAEVLAADNDRAHETNHVLFERAAALQQRLSEAEAALSALQVMAHKRVCEGGYYSHTEFEEDAVNNPHEPECERARAALAAAKATE